MAYPIKYIENNLVFNHDGECFAYYELLPYNYSFLSPEQKYQVHDSFRQLIAQNRDGKIHALQISTESSIRAAQERSKQEVTGKLKDMILSRLVDTFFSRISPTMQLPPKHHSIAYVLPWAEGLHWQSRSSGCSNS